MKLSIVIPAHNEEHRLPPVLNAYAAYFRKKMGTDAEIILVANGCTDRTACIAEGIAKKTETIRVIDEPRRIGKGGAVILGVKEARGEYIGFVDADGATSPEEFFRLYEKANGSSGLIASRWMKGADVTIPQKAMRLLSSRLFNWLTRILLGLKYKDTQCGAKIFKAEAWESILPDIGTTRFAFDVDVLYQLKRHGYTVIEEPTVWKDIEGSKVRFFNSSFDMFCAIVRMRLLYSPLSFTVKIYEHLFSKIVEYLRRDELFCHASLLFMASMVMNVCNVAYQMVVSRALPKAEYTLLATFLALFAIVSRPLISLTTAIVHYTCLLVQEGREGAVSRLIKKWILLAGIPAIAVSAVCIFLAPKIAAFFHLDRTAPIVVSALALPVVCVLPVLGGAMRGLQRFGWISLSSIIGALGRVSLGTFFVLCLFPACGWALAGHAGGMYCSAGLTVIVLFNILRKMKDDGSKLPSLRLYLFQSFLVQISMAVLMTGDMVMIKHYLPAETDFAYAATLGRMVAFLAASVVAAMFPKVSSSGTFTREHRGLYIRSLGYTMFFVAVAVFMCNFFPEFLLRVLFRLVEPSDHVISLTRWMSWAMAATTFLNINVSLLLAQRRFRMASVVIICALIYLGGVHFYHGSAHTIIYYCLGTSVLAMSVTTIGILFSKAKGAEQENGES